MDRAIKDRGALRDGEQPSGYVASLLQELNRTKAQLDALERRMQDAQVERNRALARRERHYRSLLENLPDMVFVTDTKGRLISVTGNTIGILGCTAAELMALPEEERLSWLLSSQEGARLLETLTGDLHTRSEPIKTMVRDRAGEWRAVEITLLPLYDDEYELQGCQGIVRDISDVARAERAMQSLNSAAEIVQRASFSLDQVYEATTDQLASLGFHSLIALFGPDPEQLALVRINADEMTIEAIERLLGRSLVGLTFSPSQVEAFAEAVTQRGPIHVRLDDAYVARAFPGPLAARARAISRLLLPLNVVITPLIVDDRVLGVLCVAGADLSREFIPAVAAFGNQMAIAVRNAQLVSRLAESEEQYRSIFEAATDGFIVLDRQGHIVAANPAACRMYGYTDAEMRRLTLSALLHPDDLLSGSLSALLSDMEKRNRLRHIRRDGREFPVEVHATQVVYQGQENTLLVVTDITEREEAQEALIRTERLRALGQMAGGIAHDFNNILVSIRGYADMALLDIDEHPTLLREDLGHIMAGARDAAEAVRRLQSLYREAEDTSDFVPIELDEIVREALDLTRPHWKDNAQARGVTIKVQTDLRAPPKVSGNPSEIRRVITNLVVNAVEAMSEGGLLRLSTSHGENWCAVSVSDTGIGIAPEDLGRIFDPFFSTKNSSGLGLAVSRTIAERHGGELLVESSPGQGATFTLRLPFKETERLGPEAGVPVIDASRRLGIKLNVLVVDDEPDVRKLLVRFLERNGQHVTAVSGGREALEVLASDDYDLLLTDLGMPDMSGEQLAREVHQRYPHMLIILTTGWGETVTPERLRGMYASGLLAKPFTYGEFMRVLEKALTEPEF